jgi:transcriptional regulator with XRE-family HTH domain
MKVKNPDTVKCHVEFGKFIKNARTLKGLFQQEVAEKAGITQTYVSYIERGERDIDLALALRLCEILNIDIKDFLEQYM